MRNFRLIFFCIGLLFLDIPSPFSACSPSRPVDMDEKYKIEIIHDEEKITRPYHSVLHTDLRVGDMVTEEFINYSAGVDSEYYPYYSYMDDGDVQYEVEVNSITVNYVSIGTIENQVELPYQIQEEDFLNSYDGYRNVLVIYIHISLDYELVPME